jgi:hypothetical protein
VRNRVVGQREIGVKREPGRFGSQGPALQARRLLCACLHLHRDSDLGFHAVTFCGPSPQELLPKNIKRSISPRLPSLRGTGLHRFSTWLSRFLPRRGSPGGTRESSPVLPCRVGGQQKEIRPVGTVGKRERRMRPRACRPPFPRVPRGRKLFLNAPPGTEVPGYSPSSLRDCPAGAKTGSTILRMGVVISGKCRWGWMG